MMKKLSTRKKLFFGSILVILLTISGIKFFIFKPFFEFDEVIHYKNTAYLDLNPKTGFGEKDVSFFEDFYFKNTIPKDLNDTLFIGKLDYYGFSKQEINVSKYKDLNDIFSNRIAFMSYATACVPEYNDILIFKKNKKTIGIAKICFGCDKHHILGAQSSTANFGFNNEFVDLKKLLEE